MTLQPLSLSRKRFLEKATERYHNQLDSDALAYLAGRGLSQSIETLRFGVIRSPLQGHERLVGRLVIPYVGPAGVYHMRFRCLEDHDHHLAKCRKYMGPDGEPSRMYNTPAVLANTRSVFVTEGELDAATLLTCGWPAVGIPGADSWRPHYPRVLAGFEQVIVPVDGDEAGRKFGAKVSASLPDCRVVPMPEGEDVNSFYVQHGKAGLEQMLAGKGEDE